jgi:hypothetical protein
MSLQRAYPKNNHKDTQIPSHEGVRKLRLLALVR